MKHLYSLLILIIGFPAVFAQNKAVITPPENIKTIILRSSLTNDYAPIIRLGDHFIFEFDDLNADQQQYSYRIEHYDYNWEPSGLTDTEYINGYATDWIRNYDNAFNTLQPYTHYTVTFPNENTSIKISGNYLLTVLDENDEVVFTRPFIIYEPLVDVGVTVHQSRDIATLKTDHNIELVVNHPNLNINNPGQEVKIVVYQNNDWNTRLDDIKPQFYRGSQLLYRYGDKLSFHAGNEFLYFDTKQIRVATNTIARVVLDDLFNAYLYINEARANKPYTLYPDINGNFVIRTIDSDDSALEADYCWVHFALEYYGDPEKNAVYIYGNFNGWQLTDENTMTYNEASKMYTGKLLLKQGFYNYTYVTANAEKEVNNQEIEGSFYQTEDMYTALVYYRPFGSRYDRVIGYGNASSEILRN